MALAAQGCLALCRFGQDAAALLLWGASVLLAGCVPAPLAALVAHRLRGWGRAAVAVTAVATAAKLPATVASIGDGWRDALDPAVVGSVLAGTGAGRSWSLQAFAVLLLLLSLRLPPRCRTVGTAGASGLLLAALALTGHAVAEDGWRGALHRGVDVLHVLSGGAWLGALVPVLVILGLLDDPRRREGAALALRRFSRAGHGAVALVMLSGAADAALILGRWPSRLSSPYDALLDAKVAAVAAMAGLALVNRYLLVPRIARHPEAAAAALRRATLAEVPLGLGAVALVAVFGLLDPN